MDRAQRDVLEAMLSEVHRLLRTGPWGCILLGHAVPLDSRANSTGLTRIIGQHGRSSEKPRKSDRQVAGPMP
jgi:hypothetical protein